MLFPLHYWRDIIIGVLLWHQSRLYTDVCVLGYLLNEILFGTQLSLSLSPHLMISFRILAAVNMPAVNCSRNSRHYYHGSDMQVYVGEKNFVLNGLSKGNNLVPTTRL